MKNLCMLFFAMLLSSCAHIKDEPRTVSNDVHKGGVVKGTQTAVVSIAISDDGMPKVLVDPIIVQEGQRVVWVGPKNMTIRFPEKSPFRRNSLSTKDAVVNAVVPRLESKVDKDIYKYDIIVNGVVLDPHMIVKRAH